ncbi:MAG: hypothetical protein E6G77_25305 [Alphaproteobacteria bacterium]|nr:MAG: hypothetical protein E6G77_25305 [Alphaproteobacteria bacterium]
MGRLETIRGLERGLLVLQALETNPIASLHEIHLATRISKPSLLRILNTLERAGYVSRRLVDGHYRISSFARVGRKRDRYDRVAEAAAPVLDRLCQKVRWPSDAAHGRRTSVSGVLSGAGARTHSAKATQIGEAGRQARARSKEARRDLCGGARARLCHTRSHFPRRSLWTAAIR